MKAMLIWSDGTEINQSIYEDKDGVSGVDRAVAQMHKEYAEHGDNPDEEYGSYEGDRDCCYCNDSEDMCHWLVVELPEDKNFVLPLLYPDAMELLRTLIDSVEDFLDDKGITPEMLPNADRESNSDAALIYGTDYDDLQTGLLSILESVSIQMITIMTRKKWQKRLQIIYRKIYCMQHIDGNRCFIAWMMCIAMRTISELKFRRKRLSRLLKSLLRIMTVMLRKMTCFGN